MPTTSTSTSTSTSTGPSTGCGSSRSTSTARDTYQRYASRLTVAERIRPRNCVVASWWLPWSVRSRSRVATPTGDGRGRGRGRGRFRSLGTNPGARACGGSGESRPSGLPCGRARSFQSPGPGRAVPLARNTSRHHRPTTAPVSPRSTDDAVPLRAVRAGRLREEPTLPHRWVQFVAECLGDRHSSTTSLAAFSVPFLPDFGPTGSRTTGRTCWSARRSCLAPGHPWSLADRPPQGAALGGKRRRDTFGTKPHKSISRLDGHHVDGGVRQHLHESPPPLPCAPRSNLCASRTRRTRTRATCPSRSARWSR